MGFLKVSENNRYFTMDGKPFFWMGDTIWPAVSWYSMEELETYFARRKEQGFNVMHIMLAWAYVMDNEKHLGLAIPEEKIPLWLNNDPTTPNEEFFKKLDQIIAMAAKYDILVTILPNGGSMGTHVDQEKIITTENARAYGKWLGSRYKNEPNIAWVNGFDLLPWLYEDVAREFTEGLIEADEGNHLLFFHPCGGASSNHFHNEKWLAANFIQTWSDMESIQGMVTADYYRKPYKPVVHVEGAYEAGTEYTSAPITSWHVREQAYRSYLSGGFHTYGHNDLWRKPPYWKDALDSKGAWQMKILKDFFTSLEWWKLEPVYKLITPLFKYGHAAMCSADGDFAVIYYAHRSTLKVDFSKLRNAKKVTGEWIDPQNGKSLKKESFQGPICNIPSPAQLDDALLLLKPE